MKTKCPTKGCLKFTTQNSKLIHCSNCRAAMNRAAKLGAGYIKERTRTVLMYAYRLRSVAKRKAAKRG